eukprot:XP_001703985.1 Hypothetical protein GL50803_35192 [Giardia lamblia ATCC 50803]
MQAMCVIIWQLSHMFRIRSRHWWKRQQERPQHGGHCRHRCGCHRCCGGPRRLPLLVVPLPREGVGLTVYLGSKPSSMGLLGVCSC